MTVRFAPAASATKSHTSCTVKERVRNKFPILAEGRQFFAIPPGGSESSPSEIPGRASACHRQCSALPSLDPP